MEKLGWERDACGLGVGRQDVVCQRCGRRYPTRLRRVRGFGRNLTAWALLLVFTLIILMIAIAVMALLA